LRFERVATPRPRRPRVARSRAEKLPLHFLILRAPIFSLEGKGNFSARHSRRKRRLAAGQSKFRFLDLWIKFGKTISKVCWCFNSAANIAVCLEQNPNFFLRKSGRQFLIISTRSGRETKTLQTGCPS